MTVGNYYREIQNIPINLLCCTCSVKLWCSDFEDLKNIDKVHKECNQNWKVRKILRNFFGLIVASVYHCSIRPLRFAEIMYWKGKCLTALCRHNVLEKKNQHVSYQVASLIIIETAYSFHFSCDWVNLKQVSAWFESLQFVPEITL